MGKHNENEPPPECTEGRAGGLSPPRVCRGTRTLPASWYTVAERLLGIGALSWEPGREHMSWSDGLYQLLEYEHKVEPTYHNFVTAFHPEDRPELLNRLEQALDTGASFSLRLRLAEGRQVGGLHVAAMPLTDGKQRVARLDLVVARELQAPQAAYTPAAGEGLCAEPAVRFDRELMRATLDGISDVIFAFDDTGHSTLWNRAAELLTGKSAAEVIGSHGLDLFPFLRQVGFDALYARALAGERASLQGCHVKIPHQGFDHYYDVDFVPLKGLGGAIIGGVGIMHDVTALKRAEQSLRQREQEFEAIAENSPDIIVQLDREHRVIYVNRQVESVTGRPRCYLLGKTYHELGMAPDQQDQWDALLTQAFERQVRGDREFILVDLHGKCRTFEWCLVPEQQEGEKVVTVLAIARDVTERKHMEEALRLKEQEFRTLAESVPDMITRLDRSLRPLYANRAAERHTGRLPEDYISARGEETDMPGAPLTLWNKVLPRVFDTGEPATLEFFVPVQTGTRVFETRIIPERENDGPVRSVITLSRDITDRKRAEDQLRQANRQLQRAMDELRISQRQFIQAEKLSALGTLAAGIAHELNNPMMGVMNYVDYARRVVVNPMAKEMLERATHELERMRDLLKNMLTFTRPVNEPVRPVALDRVIKAALSLLAPELRARGIEVVVDLAATLPGVMAHEGQLQQVFVNVLMNARDALESSVTRRVHIRAEPDGSDVRVDFTDSGPGIPTEIQDKIFDPFFTTKPPGRGTGLGLSISRTLMLELGGDLRYHRPEQGGTTISVVVPAAAHEDLRS